MHETSEFSTHSTVYYSILNKHSHSRVHGNNRCLPSQDIKISYGSTLERDENEEGEGERNEAMGAFIMYGQRSIISSLPIRNEEPISLSISLSLVHKLDSLAFGVLLGARPRLYRFETTELINKATIFFPVLKPWNHQPPFPLSHRSLGIKRAEIRQTDVFPTRSKDCMETKAERGGEECVGRERELDIVNLRRY